MSGRCSLFHHLDVFGLAAEIFTVSQCSIVEIGKASVG
jgi:hypothetical protein